MRWLGGVFLLALITSAFAVYSDIAITGANRDHSLRC
jgi:hypothetical protein